MTLLFKLIIGNVLVLTIPLKNMEQLMLKVKEKVTSFWQNHDLDKFVLYEIVTTSYHIIRACD